MADLSKGTPRFILEGFDDESQGVNAVEQVQLPQHLPLQYLLTERGRETPTICIGNGFAKNYGAVSLDPTSRFATHSTIMASTIMARANQIMVQRLRPALAKTAMIRLSVEMIPYAVPLYQRNSNGSIKTDVAGNPLPVMTETSPSVPVTVNGHRLVWHASTDMYPDVQKPLGAGEIISSYRYGDTNMGGSALSGLTTSVQDFDVYATSTANVALTGAAPLMLPTTSGTVNIPDGEYVHLNAQTISGNNGYYRIAVSAGTYTLTKWTGTAPVSSTVFPIIDIPVDSFGEYGNRIGLQLEAPNVDSVIPGNAALMDTIGAFLYRFTCVERPANSTTPNITLTTNGNTVVNATFRDNTLDPVSGNQLSVADVFTQSYQSLDTPGLPPVYGPFGDVYIYRENFGTVLDILINGTSSTDTINAPITVTENVPLSDQVGNAVWQVTQDSIVHLTGQADPTLNGFYGVEVATDALDPNIQVYTLTPFNPSQIDQVATLGEAFFDAEASDYGRTSSLGFSKAGNAHLLNIFTGVDQNNVPYFSFDVRNSVVFGGVAFGTGRTIYASGGSDGLPVDMNGKPDMVATMAVYDDLVANQASNFGNLPDLQLLNIPKYPCSTLWDSGFTLATKKALMVPMSRRPDMWIVLATQELGAYNGVAVNTAYTTHTVNGVSQTVLGNGTVVEVGMNIVVSARSLTPSSGSLLPYIPSGAYQVTSLETGVATLTPFVLQKANDEDTDSANSLILNEAVTQYPESALYGTGTCRAMIVGRCGKLLNSTYKGIMPLTIDVADKVSRYMGRGDGKWNSAYPMDENPNNIVSMFRDINITWRTDNAYDTDWSNGMVWVEDYDTERQWYPAFQTVYKDDTSVLNSFLTVVACAYVWKLVIKSWQNSSGNSRLTPAQFVQKNNKFLNDAVKGIFDKRFVVAVNTYQTPDDSARGFSYKSSVRVYANPMILVGDFTVVADRQSNLPSGNAAAAGVIA